MAGDPSHPRVLVALAGGLEALDWERVGEVDGGEGGG